eukprot:g438.t1
MVSYQDLSCSEMLIHSTQRSRRYGNSLRKSRCRAAAIVRRGGTANPRVGGAIPAAAEVAGRIPEAVPADAITVAGPTMGDQTRIGGHTTDMGKDNHKITLEGIPHDMTWTELKELGKQHSSRPGEVTFARTFRNRSNLACGILEFRSKSIAEDVIDKLNGRKIKGHDDRLDVKMGDLSRGNY